MQIKTTNERGERVLINYEETAIKQKESKPDIEITNYQQFKRCIRCMNEQKEYSGGGDKRYEKALSTLLKNDRTAYQRYSDKLHEEYRSSR